MTLSHFNKGTLLGGIGVTGLWFAVSRAVQLASGLWVTRQLLPSDFAILATVFAIQGFAQQLLGINLSTQLVRAKQIDPEDLQVAWTYEFLRNISLFLLIFLIAPYFAEWMERPEATLPLRLSAAGLLIGSFRNPRLIELRRDGRFGLLGALDGIPNIAYAVFAITLVSIRADYWSLIYAGLGSSVLSILITYFRLPWKPSINFDWSRVKPMFSFGVVILVIGGLAALREHGMVFLISKSGSSDELGYYNRGVAFSFALALQAVSVFWRVAYPHYSQIQIRGVNPLQEAQKAQKTILLVGIPAVVIGILAGRELIPIILGTKWLPIIPVWSGFLVAGVFALASAPFEAAFQACGKEWLVLRFTSIFTLLQILVSWALLIPLGIVGTSVGACFALLISTATYRLVTNRMIKPIPSPLH